MLSLQYYRNTPTPHLAALIEQSPDPDDAITFSVLTRLVRNPNTVTITDETGIIICYSNHPYPVWVYARTPYTEDTVETVADCLLTHLPLTAGYRYCLTPELYDALCAYDARFANTRLEMGLISHRLDTLNVIDRPCDGGVSLAREAELPLLTALWHDLTFEMEGFDLSPAVCEGKVRGLLSDGSLFAWRNAQDEIVALTSRRPFGKYGKVSAVYTLPAYRRRGYAINLVYYVTKTLMDDGMIPILYTDGGYAPSNACYAKIGYREVGRLCNIGVNS